jgi:uncharacterized membrane protein
MTAIARGLASRRLRASLARRSAGIVMAAALVACPRAAPPPPGDSRSVPAVPPASSKPPSAPSPAQQSAPENNSFTVVGVAEGDVLNLRSAPDRSSALIGSIPRGSADVIGVGTPTQVEQTTWQRVRFGGIVGWVNARFLQAKGGAPAVASSAPARPGQASTVNLDGLLPLICFGNEPFWGIQFKADGSATCEAMCEGPPSLRIANLSRTASGDPQGFDLLDAQGGLFLHGTLRRTGQCSDGMSDNVHPYVFTATGKRGPLQGCCRDKRVKLSSG